MKKTVLITGSTDGIGLKAAETLSAQGHTILLHGRNESKLESAKELISSLSKEGKVEGFIADISSLDEVVRLANDIKAFHPKNDVLINNAGVFKTDNPSTEYGIDIRFVVNTIAPYLLTQKLIEVMHSESRVINLSSAAQAPVELDALKGKVALNDMEAYSQSKLAITMWTRKMAKDHANGTSFVAVNPGSLLATKMVKEGFGVSGNDITIGSDILCGLAISKEFNDSSGKYFDNDQGHFANPHPDGVDDTKCELVTNAIQEFLRGL